MLLSIDGFQGYALYSERWNDSSGLGPTADGRFSTNGYRAAGGAVGPRNLHKLLTTNYAELIAGVACSLAGGGEILGFYDTIGGFTQVVIVASGSNMVVYRGNPNEGGTGTLATLPGVLATAYSRFNYYEVRTKIHNSTGTVEVRMNGATLVSLTGQDTSRTGNEYASGVYLGNITNNNTLGNSWDDFYVCDTVDSGIAGAPNNDFLGDVHVETVYPNGNGASSQFDGSDGNSIDNYLLVDETAQDGDTTYVESGDIGDKDTYAYSNMVASTGTVYGVQINPYAKKTASGTRSFKTIARTGGGTEQDGAEKFLGTSYTWYPSPRDGDPDGNQWTISNVNAAEFGQKVFS